MNAWFDRLQFPRQSNLIKYAYYNSNKIKEMVKTQL